MTSERKSETKMVTVICTTPWGERHEFKARVREAQTHFGITSIIILTANGDAVMFMGDRQQMLTGATREQTGPFRYELGPHWRQEIADV